MALANTVATGFTPLLHTQTPLVLLSGLPFVHHELAVHALVVVTAPVVATLIFSALTSTGIIAPVTRLNVLCPSTLSRLPASPECVVIDTIEAGSEEKTESRAVFER